VALEQGTPLNLICRAKKPTLPFNAKTDGDRILPGLTRFFSERASGMTNIAPVRSQKMRTKTIWQKMQYV